MNEREFDKIFRDRLSEPAEGVSEQDNWQKVAAALGPQQGSNGLRTMWWLPFLLLLLVWNGWQSVQMRHLKTEFSTFKTGTATQLVRQFDTIWQTTTVIKRDTVVRYIYLMNKTNWKVKSPYISSSVLEQPLPTQIGSAAQIDPSVKMDNFGKTTTLQPTESTVLHNTASIELAKKTPTETTNLPSDIASKSLINNDLDINSDVKTTATQQPLKTAIAETDLPKIDSIQTRITVHEPTENDTVFAKKPPLSIAQLDSIETAVEQKAKARKTAEKAENEAASKKAAAANKQPIRLDGFGILSGASWLSPNSSNINTAAWIGTRGDIALSRRTRLSLSVDYSKLDFKVYDLAAPLNIQNVQPPNPNYNLEYIEGTQKSWQLGSSLQYLFLPNRRIQPLMSAGYTYRIIPSFEMEVEYKNTITGEKMDYETANPRHFDHWFNLGAGAEMRLFKRLAAQGRLDYFHDFNNHVGSSQGYWILRGGLFYKF